MSSSLLPIIRDNAEYDLENIIPDILNNEVESKYFHLSWDAYHIRAISTLLLECDVNGFYLNLHRSASAYLFYLQKIVVESERKTSPGAIKKILTHLGLSPHLPPKFPARYDPYDEADIYSTY